MTVTQISSKPKFAHFRRVRQGSHKELALTLAMETRGDEVLVGMAAVSDKDNGSRRCGRFISATRLKSLTEGRQSLNLAHRIPADKIEHFLEDLRNLEVQNKISFSDGAIPSVIQRYVSYPVSSR